MKEIKFANGDMDLLTFYKEHHKVIDKDSLFSNESYGTIKEMLDLYFEVALPLDNAPSEYTINSSIRKRRTSLSSEEVIELIELADKYSNKYNSKAKNIVETISGFKEKSQDVVEYLFKNDELFKKYGSLYVNFIEEKAHTLSFENGLEIYMEKLKELNPARAKTARAFNLNYDIEETKKIWKKMPMGEVKKFAFDIRDTARDINYLDLFLQTRLINGRVKESTVSDFIKRAIIGVHRNIVTNNRLVKSDGVLDFVNKYEDYIFSEDMINTVNVSYGHTNGMYSLLRILFENNTHIDTISLLKYFIKDGLGSDIKASVFTGNRYSYRREERNSYGIESMFDILGCKDRIISELADEEYTEELRTFISDQFDIIENSDTIPKHLRKLYYVFVQNLTELTKNVELCELIGEENLKRFTKLYVESYEKYVDVVKDAVDSMKGLDLEFEGTHHYIAIYGNSWGDGWNVSKVEDDKYLYRSSRDISNFNNLELKISKHISNVKNNRALKNLALICTSNDNYYKIDLSDDNIINLYDSKIIAPNLFVALNKSADNKILKHNLDLFKDRIKSIIDIINEDNKSSYDWITENNKSSWRKSIMPDIRLNSLYVNQDEDLKAVSNLVMTADRNPEIIDYIVRMDEIDEFFNDVENKHRRTDVIKVLDKALLHEDITEETKETIDTLNSLLELAEFGGGF